MAGEHEIVAMERKALERWCKGDPSGFLEICAPDVVYFDHALPKRLDGLDGLRAYYGGFHDNAAGAEGFEMIDPKVQEGSDMAVLTFNYLYRAVSEDGLKRWNTTEVYRRTPSGWRIIQTHWSPTQPKLARSD